MHLAHKWKGHILNIKTKKQNKITRSPFFIVSNLQQRQKQESNHIYKKKKWCCRLWRRLTIKSQRCSIQLRSGLHGGQFMTWIPESLRKHVVTLEVCALAPSCINPKSGPISCAKGRHGSTQLQHTSRLLSSPGWKWVSLVVQGNSSPNHQWSSAIRSSPQ